MREESNIIDADDDEEASVIKFVNQVLAEAIERRATDVHFEPFEKILRVRYRVDGVLQEANVPAEVLRFPPAIVVGYVAEAADTEVGFALRTTVEPAANISELDFVKIVVGWSPLDAGVYVDVELPFVEPPPVVVDPRIEP